jgi:hypothetical protein
MVRIPQYNRSVTPQNTPLGYARGQADPNAFGVGATEALRNTGKSLDNLGNSMFELKAQYDRTKVIEVGNMLDKYINDVLNDKDNGYLFKSGKDAMGKSPEIMDGYDKYSDEIISKGGFWGENERYIRNIAAQKRMGLERYSEAHDREESDKWQDSVYTDALTNIFNKAINGRNNPADIEKFRKDGYTLLDNYALVKGWNKDPQTFEMKKKEFEGNFNAQILDAYLAEGSLKASEYFHKHKDKFTPEVQNRYLQRIHTEEVNYGARSTAESLIGKSTEEAYKFIDDIENIEMRNATENEYNRLLRHQETIQKQNDIKASNEIMQKVYAAYDNGEDIYSIMREVNTSNMSLEQKEKIYNNLKTMQELEGVGNNWADYNILLDMAAYNNEEFKTINPANYNLTKEQYNKIIEMQRKSAANEYTPETEMRKILRQLSGFAPQTSNGLKTNEYKDEVVRFLSKVERMQGEAFDFKNTQQLDAIMEGFNYKDADATNKNIDETKELFARAKKHGEVYDLMAREYMLFKGQNKREPNPEEIYEMAKRSYNTIENEWRERDMGKLNRAQGIYDNVTSTTAKQGETKVLTYYADTRIPQISRELGIPLQVTSRYRAGDSGGHGKGRKCDVGMAALNNAQRQRVFEKLLTEPAVASIGTSDPVLLKRYNSPPNPKIRDLRSYDANYKKRHPNTTMNHINHIDISFDTRYGGNVQGI